MMPWTIKNCILKQLLFIVIVAPNVNVIEAELIRILGRGHNTDPVPKRILLQELFSEVFEVSLG